MLLFVLQVQRRQASKPLLVPAMHIRGREPFQPLHTLEAREKSHQAYLLHQKLLQNWLSVLYHIKPFLVEQVGSEQFRL